jgi:hypothetical protein
MKRRHSWTKPTNAELYDYCHPERTATCIRCGLIRLSSGYDLRRSYRWEGPPQLWWEERAPACPPDLATGRPLVALEAAS